MKKDRLDQIADALVYEALNVVDGADAGTVEKATAAGAGMGISGIEYSLPVEPAAREAGVVKDFSTFAESVSSAVDSVLEDVETLTEEQQYDLFVSSLNESLTELGYEEYGQIVEEIATNPSLNDMSRLYGMIKQLIKENVDDEIIENLYLFSTALMSLAEAEKEPPVSRGGMADGDREDEDGENEEEDDEDGEDTAGNG